MRTVKATCREMGKRPLRMYVTVSGVDNHVMRRVGFGTGSYNRSTGSWSFPMDVTILKSLVTEFPDISLSSELRDYLQRELQKQQRIAQAVKDTTEIFPEDTLWGFQRASVRFLDEVGRGVLGHDTGTGKTVVASSAIRYISTPRNIIVCPDNVKWSWVDHLSEWAHIKKVFVLDAANIKISTNAAVIRGSTAVRDDNLAKAITTNREFTLVMNYRQLAIHQKTLASVDYDLMILDEAHRIKNRKAQQTKAAHFVARKCAKVWMLTATAVRNNETDLWSLLHLADPIRFSSYWNFINANFNTIPGIYGGIEIMGLRDTTAFNSVLAQYMFAKSKEELLPDLPKKMPPVVYKLAMVPSQAKLYLQMEQEFVAEIKRSMADGKTLEHVIRAPNTVAQLIRLRQICLTPDLLIEDITKKDIHNSAKLLALRDLIEDIQATGERFLIFSNFRQFLPYVEQILREFKVKYSWITGAKSSSERAKAQQELTDGVIDCILGTTQSMGEGMNLQAATTAIFCDMDWVPAVNKQAEDRIHRLGITKPPTIIRLYHPRTVESDILLTCERKEAIIDQTVGQVEIVRRIMQRSEIVI